MADIGMVDAIVAEDSQPPPPVTQTRPANPLLDGPILRTLVRLATPNILSMGASICIVIAETSYVGRLGTAPLAAIALMFPIITLMLTMSGGKVASCTIGLTNLHETPLLAVDAAKAVIGTSLDAATLKKAAAAAEAIMSPASDARGPVEYRKHVGGIMVTRALTRAAARAS